MGYCMSDHWSNLLQVSEILLDLRRDDRQNSPSSAFVLFAQLLSVCLHCVLRTKNSLFVEIKIYNEHYSKGSMEANTFYVLKM